MGFTISKILNKDQKKLSFEFGDGDTFDYYVSSNRLTFDVVDKLQSAMAELTAENDDEVEDMENVTGEESLTDAQKRSVGVLAELIVTWDLEDEEGNELPPTSEAILSLPVAMIVSMMEKIMEVVSPN